MLDDDPVFRVLEQQLCFKVSVVNLHEKFTYKKLTRSVLHGFVLTLCLRMIIDSYRKSEHELRTSAIKE